MKRIWQEKLSQKKLGNENMSRKHTYLWCLMNTESGGLVEGLSFDEVRAALTLCEVEHLPHWYAWREDWSHWRAVIEVVGLDEPIHRKMVRPPPTPPNISGPDGLKLVSVKAPETQTVTVSTQHSRRKSPRKSRGKSQAKENAKQMIQSSHKEPDKELGKESGKEQSNRRYKRYKKGFELVIESDGQSFQTQTVDLSIGGILLQDSVPEWVVGYFTVRIVRSDISQQVELTCCLVENQSPGQRRRLELVPLADTSDEERLEEWFAA